MFLMVLTLIMKDIDIRLPLKQKIQLENNFCEDALIVDELGLSHGNSRIDLAVIQHTLSGFEIKSDRDSLSRLPRQIEMYNKVFEKVTIVTGQRHLFSVFDEVPLWWEIIRARKNMCGEIVFDTIRKGERNPKVEAAYIVKLLWKEEALRILEKVCSIHGFSSKSKSDIYSKLLLEFNDSLMIKLVCQTLKNRKNWQVGSLQKSNDD